MSDGGSVPDVAVVVCHYDAPEQLDLVLAGLAAQTLPADRFEVVVSDDGSQRLPRLRRQAFATSVVRQPDDGFRAAAARNSGAAASTGRLICFLDGDTVPEPGYLAALLSAADEVSQALVVGRRRHGDLAGWDAERLRGWFAGRTAGPEELPEPEWLQDGYRWTGDLREADDESYRFVISAVLGVDRGLFERAGQFDERFTAYGGEDWELANRCWLAGGRLRYVPDAVAWHDGVEFAGREVDRRAVHEHQALMLARLLPSAATRPPGLVWEYPQVVVEVDDRGWGTQQVLRCVASVLAGSDAGVWLVDGAVAAPGGVLSADPRVHAGAPPADVLRRARARVRVDRPLEVVVSLTELVARAPLSAPGLRVEHARSVAPASSAWPKAPAEEQGLVEPMDVTTGLGELLRSRSEGHAPMRRAAPGS